MTDTPTAERKKPGRKPRPAVTDTPEFQAAVARVANEAVQAALSGLAPKMEAAGLPVVGSQDWMQTLAVTLAEIGSQGTGRKTVAPHILKQRENARELMVNLIIKARAEYQMARAENNSGLAKKWSPQYQLRNKVVLAERVIEPFWITSDKKTKPTEIDWFGVPNEAMVPINDTAKEIHTAFMDSIGTVERVVPEERLGVTPGGLVVRNAAVTDTMAKRTTGEAPHVGDGKSDDGLVIHHENEPGRYKAVHVLGTVQEPARQTI